MSDKTKFFFLLLIFGGVGIASLIFLFFADIAVLNPKGIIAAKQKDLLVISTLLMLIVVIPVFVLTFGIAWKYRASRPERKKNQKYTPNWDYNFWAETIWWGIPFAIIVVLGVLTWKGCHDLDPFKPIQAERSMPIQVVALQWKWLFLYPKQGIATVNFVQFPENTAINFEITSDAPMNSFWIPQLGGQVYAMSGMRSKLHLIAEKGEYRGSSANISGTGFSGMNFIAKASTQEEFDDWVASIQKQAASLGTEEYEELVKPSEYQKRAFYRLEEEHLFDQIMMKYMQ